MLRVGVLPVLDSRSGGIYQYSLTVLQALDQLRGQLDPVMAYERGTRSQIRPWEHTKWELMPLTPWTPRSLARSLLSETVGRSNADRVAHLFRRTFRLVGRGPTAEPGSNGSSPEPARGEWLRRHGIALMLYPAPTTRAFECDVPYVMAVHDLQHRIHPEFPEVSADGESEAREHLFTHGIGHAAAILVDSEIGKEDVLEFYSHLTSPERIRVLPFIPPPYLVRPDEGTVAGVLKALGISDRYLLFPAHFWPHKNHLRVAEAVAALHREGVDITVVMTGSRTGDIRERVLSEVRELAAREGIRNLVRILGYVDDRSIAALYSGATGVVLPTFFGPTNIPVIEAWAMGVPVLTSDIRGIREQCGHAAILVDPLSVEAIEDGLRRLWLDEELRRRLVAAGAERLSLSNPSAFSEQLGSILKDAAASVRASVVAA